MTATIQTLLFLLAVLVLVAVIAQRLKTAPSILLVIAGIALTVVPGLPPITLAPEFVLLVMLPPLIYSAGVSMSWREFRFNLRPIGLLAFGCVAFTTCAVAAAVHFLLGWQWGTAFALGAIVAPPERTDDLGLSLVRGPYRSLGDARSAIDMARQEVDLESPLAGRVAAAKAKPRQGSAPPPGPLGGSRHGRRTPTSRPG
jgi:CPA1 family monovalent cation:H+ antiporter